MSSKFCASRKGDSMAPFIALALYAAVFGLYINGVATALAHHDYWLAVIGLVIPPVGLFNGLIALF